MVSAYHFPVFLSLLSTKSVGSVQCAIKHCRILSATIYPATKSSVTIKYKNILNYFVIHFRDELVLLLVFVFLLLLLSAKKA